MFVAADEGEAPNYVGRVWHGRVLLLVMLLLLLPPLLLLLTLMLAGVPEVGVAVSVDAAADVVSL